VLPEAGIEAGIEAAIEAGVHTIEHGTYLTSDTTAAMVKRDMVLVPTRTIVATLVHGSSAGEGAELATEHVTSAQSA
jgi:imidazolonepropionase-like amidohydrolase